MSKEPKREGVWNQRQSGRTTRMIAKAIDGARKGRYVFIIAADGRQKQGIWDQLRVTLRKEAESRMDGTKLQLASGGSINISTVADEFSWQTMRPSRCHPSCLVFVDHHAAEQELDAFYSAYLRLRNRIEGHLKDTGQISEVTV